MKPSQPMQMYPKKNAFKLMLSLIFSLSTIIFIGLACKKNTSSESNDAQKIDIKKTVISWLDKQESKFTKESNLVQVNNKTSSQTNQSFSNNKLSNIILLKNSLDLEYSEIVKIKFGYNLVIVPIKENIKIKKKLSLSSTLNLLLAVDNNGKVLYGRILYFIPKNDDLGKLSTSSLINMIQDEGQPVNGEFKFMDITGNWVAQKEYRNGKIYSTGIIRTKEQNNVQSNATCIDWYLVTTYHLPDGSTYTTTEYVGTTCSGCNSPEYMSLCPPEDGGGNACSLSPEEALALANATTAQSHSVTLDNFSTGGEVVDPISGEISKPVNLSPWNFLTVNIHEYLVTWVIQYSAYYNARVYKTTSSSDWKWKYVTYNNFAQTSGTMPFCYGVDVTVSPGETEFTDNNKKAKSYLSYSAICKIVCAFGYQVGDPDTGDNLVANWGTAK